MSTQTHENVVELKSDTTPVAPAAKKTPAKKKAIKAAPKTAAKRVKEPAKKIKRTAGEKAQTQVDKHLSKWLNSTAKEKSSREEKVRRADIVRQALIKGAKSMGYKLPA